MISLYDWNWRYSILVATLASIIFTYKISNHNNDESDVASAIRRAKTDVCKRELKEFSDRLFDEPYKFQLQRSCKLDLISQRNQKVGCASNDTLGLVQLEGPIANFSICLDLCFSYGHSHGGYNGSCCFCSDSGLETLKTRSNCSYRNGQEFDWYQVNNGIYIPVKSGIPLFEITNKSDEIKIAFLLILSGRSTLQIQRLLKNIYSERHVYYLHIDKRNDNLFQELSPLEHKYKNVIIAKSRFNTIWGGPSLLQMIIDAMGHLMSHNWDYLINLSESDFPIKSLQMLENYLASSNGSIYLKRHNINGYNFIKKQGLDRNFYQCENRVWRMGKRQLPRGIVYSGGSDWFALPQDFCRYIIKNLINSETLVEPLTKLYNYTLLPVESFFHTLALNSEFCDRFTDQNLRLTNWHRKQSCKCQHRDIVDWCGCSPLVHRWSDWDKLKRANSSRHLFFSRKFDPTISSSIIGAVETQLVKTNQAVDGIGYDTRYWQNAYTDTNEYLDSFRPSHYMEQFGLFALNQIHDFPTIEFIKFPKLKSVNLYFNEDRFVGMVYEYCDQSVCIQLLVERNSAAHLETFNSDCFIPNRRNLKVIEVNHGFDTGERMFRDYKPLNDHSNIVVYHEWLVEPGTISQSCLNSSQDGLKYSWFNPDDRLELIQNIKLKRASKPTKLSLAHRLNISKPIKSGIWTLTISQSNLNCLNYKFPVFDHATFTEKKIDTEQFNKFYSVSKSCILVDSANTKDQAHLCSNHDWSVTNNNNRSGPLLA